ncbi:MAG: hypothetical protein QM680_07775 [Luteolibacter sp.]
MCLSVETPQPETDVAPIMADDPDPNGIILNVIEEMIRKTIKVTPPQAAGIKVKETRVADYFGECDLEFSEEIFAELF